MLLARAAHIASTLAAVSLSKTSAIESAVLIADFILTLPGFPTPIPRYGETEDQLHLEEKQLKRLRSSK